MVHVYHIDQPSAPQAPGGRFNNFLTEILKGCLVYGFGSQPSAGWELTDQHPTGEWIVLRNATKSGYICIARTNQKHTISLSGTYSGVLNGVIQGVGAITGTTASNAAAHCLNTQYQGAYAGSSSWVVVADGASAVITLVSSLGASPQELTGVQSVAFTLAIGEDSTGAFIASGGHSGASGAAASTDDRLFKGFTTLTDPATGLLVAPNAIAYHDFGISSNSANIVSVAAPPKAHLSPMQWGSGGQYGKLRGVARCSEIFSMGSSNAARTLGVSAGINSRQINTPISLGSDSLFFVGATNPGGGAGHLLTNDAEFW